MTFIKPKVYTFLWMIEDIPKDVFGGWEIKGNNGMANVAV